MNRPQTTRSRNKLPEGKNVQEYARGYFEMLFQASKSIDLKPLETCLSLIQTALNQGASIWVAGNGGSAAISDHLCCDWTKGTFSDNYAPIKTHSLVANTAVLTALANDISYEQCIAEQVKMYAKKGDVAVLISSSGNSPNITLAAEACKELGVKVIGLTGFDGGKLHKAADASLHVPIANYGIVEDCHQSLMHIIAQYIARHRDNSDKPTEVLK